jgi:phosphatidyl-myo-inositol dimannoside synthase
LKVLYLTDSLSELDGVGRYAMGLIRALEHEVPGLRAEVLLARKHRPTSATVPSRWNVRVALPPDYFFYMSRARF